MFLRTNDRIINLQNVSNVNIIKDKKRIVFNLNYSIEIFTDKGDKVISDYVYWDAVSNENLQQNIDHLKEIDGFSDVFIRNAQDDGFININEISTIKFSEKKHRVIFNLSHPISYRDFDGNERVTSEFVYVNCPNFKQYKEYRNYVLNFMEGK